MLDRDHGVEVGYEQDAPKRQPVALGVVALGRVKVLHRVDVEERGPVGELGQHAQDQSGGQQRGSQPMPPQHLGQDRKAAGQVVIDSLTRQAGHARRVPPPYLGGPHEVTLVLSGHPARRRSATRRGEL